MGTLKSALRYTVLAFGIFMMLLLLYFIICSPEDLTDYEMLMSAVVSLFVADWLYEECEEDG